MSLRSTRPRFRFLSHPHNPTPTIILCALKYKWFEEKEGRDVVPAYIFKLLSESYIYRFRNTYIYIIKQRIWKKVFT